MRDSILRSRLVNLESAKDNFRNTSRGAARSGRFPALGTRIREDKRMVVDGKRQALMNATAAPCSNRFRFPCVGVLKVDPPRQLDLKS